VTCKNYLDPAFQRFVNNLPDASYVYRFRALPLDYRRFGEARVNIFLAQIGLASVVARNFIIVGIKCLTIRRKSSTFAN
jgi:hypothetical protein